MATTLNPASTQGFTLIEVLVTMLLLAIAFTAISITLIGFSRSNHQIIVKNEVARLSEQYMENYRQQGDFGTMRVDTEESVTVAGRTILFKTDFCPSGTPINMPCDAKSVYVRLTALDGTKVIQNTETYYTDLSS